MIDSNTTKNILKDLNNSLSIAQISNKYGVHRNTVRNIKNKYLMNQNNIVYTNSDFSVNKVSKINTAYKKTIQKFCLLHLNCYIYKDKPIEWAHYLCEKLNINYSDLKNYSPDKLELYPPHKDRRTFLATIRRIRAYKHISKNYGEVYHLLRNKNFFDNPPISYESFYNYAKNYWVDINFETTLGEIIDKS